MKPAEIETLKNLLHRLKDANLQPPNTPYEIWKELATLVPLPTVEIILTHNEKDFLLTYRKDEIWDGWHIPGGFILSKESIENACRRIAERELNIPISLTKIIDVYAWPDHPQSNPISIICVCKPEKEPEVGKFFTQIPKTTIKHHSDFLRTFLDGK